jgi:LysM repeat protein
MKYYLLLFFSFLLFTNTALAQDKYKKHKIEKGETIVSIAKKYKVTPYDIYRLNPDSQNGIKENTILLIPGESKTPPVAPVKEEPTKVANTIHEVKAKETLYSLAKRYNVSVEDLTKANGDSVKNGLSIGQKIIIPIKGSGVAAQAKTAEKQEARKDAPSYLFHTVAQGETKYGIAKQYGMSLQLLEELNPEVKDALPLGYKLKLSKNAVVSKEIQPTAPAKEPAYVMYTVQPKETFYSLTRRTGLSEDQITALNPDAKAGLRDGMELKLPAGTNIAEVAVNKTMADLTKTLKKSQARELALLLPFNLDKKGADSLSTQQQRLRTDKFLNMTMDFYAGALMAIDSAKALGLPLKVKIYDSRETKNASGVEAIKSSLLSANAVVGPFFQSNVEKTAVMLAERNIPVISPLSKEAGDPYANLYQSIPSAEKVKMAMLDYLKSKDANVIAVVDAKKASSRQFIKENYPMARFLDGGVTAGAMKSLLVKDKMNYVILETESTNMVLNTTKILADALAEFQLQLVVLEKTETLDYDEIPLARLTSLKMMYPSITKDNETTNDDIFARSFKQKNGIFPNQFATRGFDVTFDVIVRLFQEEDFKTVMAGKTSEQAENKFSYESSNGGNFNTGVYIMYYDTDLSVKEAQ